MSTILIGYRGCGKTTIGKRLADRLWQKFVDTDDLVTKVTGKTISQIFDEHGEARFRELEAEAVKKAMEEFRSDLPEKMALWMEDPAGVEAYSLYSGHIIVSCQTPSGPLEVAMSPQALTGFLAWLEAAPPGQRVAER